MPRNRWTRRNNNSLRMWLQTGVKRQSSPPPRNSLVLLLYGNSKSKLGGDTFQSIRGDHLLSLPIGLEYSMLLWECCKSSAKQACYFSSLSQYPFIHLGQEEQVRVKCLAQGHDTREQTGFELTILGSWVRSSTAELNGWENKYYLFQSILWLHIWSQIAQSTLLYNVYFHSS